MTISITSAAAMARVLASSIDAGLKHILELRRSQLEQYNEYDIGDLGRFYIFTDPDETIAAVEAALGFPLFVDGSPWWEHAEFHHGYAELTFILSDDGFGHVALISERTGNTQLLALLRRHI